MLFLDGDHYTFNIKGENTIHLKIFNPYPFSINFNHEELPVVFEIAFLRNGNLVDIEESQSS